MAFEILTKDEAAGRARISRRLLGKEIQAGRGLSLTIQTNALAGLNDLVPQRRNSLFYEPVAR